MEKWASKENCSPNFTMKLGLWNVGTFPKIQQLFQDPISNSCDLTILSSTQKWASVNSCCGHPGVVMTCIERSHDKDMSTSIEDITCNCFPHRVVVGEGHGMLLDTSQYSSSLQNEYTAVCTAIFTVIAVKYRNDIRFCTKIITILIIKKWHSFNFKLKIAIEVIQRRRDFFKT